MSTSCAIIQRLSDGSYRGIYCHYDGYPEAVGKTLSRRYRLDKKLTQLIDLGNISSLGHRVDPIGKHSFNKPEEGTTVAYHRDRGGPLVGPYYGSTVDKVREQINAFYYYVWENNNWTVNGQAFYEENGKIIITPLTEPS